MARTSGDIVIDAPADRVMAAIADFEAYPRWATGMRTVEVRSVGANGLAETVYFELDASPIRDHYTLAYTWNGDRSVSWQIAEPGEMLTSMDGAYTLEPVGGGGTKVTYQLRVEVSIPLLGMLKRKAEKVVVDAALKGLKRHVEAAGD
ncbi:MAG: SRPBCC family protein [Aeromicrobium sp.]|uniref:SRPBCC family protein n=1 Tax=Aeromicrobium sp. TaxID=1871063 RepID=UPI0039E50ADD